MKWAGLLCLLPAGAVILCFAAPYAAALALPFTDRGGGLAASGTTARGAPAFFLYTDPSVLRVVRFTVVQALLSAALSLALGLPGALLLSRLRGRAAFILRSVCSLPFALPPILAVLGFVLFFGNSGWLNRALQAALSAIAPNSPADAGAPLQILYKPAAIVLAHGFYNFPIAVRLAGDGIARARRAYAPAAASLGASPLAFTLTVLLPLVAPALAASFLLAFLYSFTSFAVVLVLGGGPTASTLAVEIFRSARVALDYGRAGALCIAETLIAALAFGLYLACDRKGRALSVQNAPLLDAYGPKHGAKGVSGAARRILTLMYAVPTGVFVLGPLLSVAAEGFLARPSRAALPVPTLRWWAALGERALPALGRSALVAALAATAACILAVLAAGAVTALKKRPLSASLLRFLCSSPLASSGVVLSLGFALLYGRAFSRTAVALVILHAVIALPFSFSSVLRGFESVSATLDAAAASLGASPPIRLITVDIPLALPQIRSAWGFAAAISLGELNSALMLGMEGWETLPLLVYRAAGAYRYGTACSAGALLLAACTGAFMLSEIGRKDAPHGHQCPPPNASGRKGGTRRQHNKPQNRKKLEQGEAAQVSTYSTHIRTDYAAL